MNEQKIKNEIKNLKNRILALEFILDKSEYIDLGLPSGTLWSVKSVKGYYSFDEAIETFGGNLPARWQFCELIDNCECRFDDEKKALVCKSKFNGKMIEFPTLGLLSYDSGELYEVGTYGCYWSRTLDSIDNNYAWCFDFYHGKAINPSSECHRLCGLSVCLCKSKK